MPLTVTAQRSPTVRLLTGLAVTLTAVAVYSGYTIVQLRGLKDLQARTVDRNRTDSLLLLRIQNNLNSVALAIRDMLDGSEPYPLTAWQPQFRRIRIDLEDALAREREYSPAQRASDQSAFLRSSVTQFWDALDRIFETARNGHEAEARDLVRLSLQARQEALSTAVARLLVQNNEAEQEAAARTREIYDRAGRNVWIFAVAAAIVIVLTSLYLVHHNRRMFQQVAALSERRRELAQQSIAFQESAFGSISRELHDDFGQILTAIGVMLQQVEKRSLHNPEALRGELRELQEIVQSTLDKVRSLSHALHPVALDESGLESALDRYLPKFEKQTGISIRYEKAGLSRDLDGVLSIHLYRVMQEALANVARHSHSARAAVRLRFLPREVVLEVEDEGIGFQEGEPQGMGLVSMRERAELVNGRLELLGRDGGGALVRLTAPISEDVHA